MGIFDSLTDAFTGRPAKEAAAANTARLNQLQTTGTNTLNQGQTSALGALDQAGAAYDPLKALGAKYGGGTNLYLDSLGVNGPEGNTRATGAFQAGPGYQYAVDQSLDGVARHAAATGVAAGGNTLAALGDRAGNLANQEYGSWQSKLGGLVSPELSATSGAASGIAGVDTNRANTYQGTANSIVGLDTNTTNGINNQTTQSANAEMAGSGNLWGLGLNLAKLGVGAATGGTSLLGGGGLNVTKLGFNPIAGAAGG
jgi:hypothetical protein